MSYSKAESASEISSSKRVKLLKGVTAFAALSQAALEQVAARLAEGRYDEGAVIVNEGEAGDALFLIAEGRAEVSIKSASGTIPLAVLRVGEIFGEIALLSPEARRQATVTALEPIVALALSASDFNQLLDQHAEIRKALDEAADDMLVEKFLKQASPFAKLEPERLKELAARLEPVSAEKGEAIIMEGERGSACYLLREGRAEVITIEGGKPKRLALLGAGALFGEAALLTGEPRAATVRAVEPCRLLVLRRIDLIEEMGTDQMIGAQMIEMLRMRDRPRRAPSITEHPRMTDEGETITILKDAKRGAYYRLSPQGYFIWQRLDGKHGIRDIALDYLAQFKSFAPEAIAQIILGLASAGFIETRRLRADVLAATNRPTSWQRTVQAARRLLAWEIFINNIDGFITRLYRALRFLYTRAAKVVLAMIAITGLAAFAATSGKAGVALKQVEAGPLLVAMIATYMISLVLHETGHALTTKHFGFEVRRAGVGWYWFSPVAFVDTSDMWLADKWQRIWVSIAGPYTNVVLGGAAAIICLFVSSPVAVAGLWQFALVSYLIVLFNLNPLMEYDGYYVLMDWMERPNLRSRTLQWLGASLPAAMRNRDHIKGHRFDLLYGIGALGYVILMGVVTLVSYRLVVEQWIAGVVSAETAAALAWAVAALVVALCLIMMIGEMRGSRATATGARH